MDCQEKLLQFGKNIQELREKVGLSTKELAKISGINKRYIEKIERGQAKRIKCYYIFIFKKTLNTTIEELLKGI